MPYHDMTVVSLTGRPWHEFDRALMERKQKIGVLTDGEHTPAAIAQRMLEYGYDYYQMSVGEHLGSETDERVTTLSLKEAAKQEFKRPNCLILSLPFMGRLEGASPLASLTMSLPCLTAVKR